MDIPISAKDPVRSNLPSTNTKTSPSSALELANTMNLGPALGMDAAFFRVCLRKGGTGGPWRSHQ